MDGRVWLALILTALVVLGYAGVSSRPMSILPAEEGLTVGVYGWQPSLYGELYSAKNPPLKPEKWEEGWELVSDDPHVYIFGYWHTFTQKTVYRYWERTDVRIEVGQPWREKHQDIEYWVEVGDGEYVHVKGEVWIYHVDLDFSIVSREKPDAGIHVYENIPVWIVFATTVWDRALKDPDSGVLGRAWVAPISVYVEGFKVQRGSGDHSLIEPSAIGRFITLYDEASTAGATIDDLGLHEGVSVNETLAGDLRPDSRMRTAAYGRWLLADLGPDTAWSWGSIVSQKFPAVNYKLKVYYLAIGKWTFTKEEQEEWEDREADQRRYGWFAKWIWLWDGVAQALGMANPFRMFGPWAGFIAFIAFVLIVFGLVYLVLTVTLDRLLELYTET